MNYLEAEFIRLFSRLPWHFLDRLQGSPILHKAEKRQGFPENWFIIPASNFRIFTG
jgi:hypothetical protein